MFSKYEKCSGEARKDLLVSEEENPITLFSPFPLPISLLPRQKGKNLQMRNSPFFKSEYFYKPQSMGNSKCSF